VLIFICMALREFGLVTVWDLFGVGSIQLHNRHEIGKLFEWGHRDRYFS
jgi:hypothetical protein